MFYRRITDVDDHKPGKRKRSDPYDSPAKRRKQAYEDSDTDEDEHDEVHEFRRVQIIYREFSSSTEQPISPEDTTGDCIKEVYDTVHHNGERDITDKDRRSRRGYAADDGLGLQKALETQRAERDRFRQQYQRNRIFAPSTADGPPRHSRHRLTEHMRYAKGRFELPPNLAPRSLSRSTTNSHARFAYKINDYKSEGQSAYTFLRYITS